MIALLLTVCAYQLREGVTPVQKVLTMMAEMKAKGKDEMAKEASLFADYESWCKETTNTKEDAIREAGALVEKLSARIQKADAEAARLTDEVAGLNSDIAKMQADKKASTEIREEEQADFAVVHADYTESVDAMGAALRTLQDVAGSKANALVQTTIEGLPAKARAVLTAFLESSADGLPSGSPAGNAYESSVGSVVEMIDELRTKMSGERADLEKNEANAKHAYQMVQQQLTMSLETASDELDAKSERKAQRVSESAADSGDLEETTATKTADSEYLSELTALCVQKRVDFDARQVLRGEELEALQKAIDIIGGGSVSGAADKHLPKLLQTSFAMLRSKVAVQTSVAQRLQAKAMRTGSKVLSQAAALVQEQGHFDKVLNMIKEMIAKLTQEAAEEAEHKAWCDGELASNHQTRTAKTQAIDQLMALSESLSADIAKLSQECSDLSAAIAELDAGVAAATANRQKEKAENTVAIADAKEATAAVKQAIGVLKEFYAKAATATSFAQGPGDDAPESFDTPYQGQGGAKGGVMGMLDVILSDFVRLDSETTAEEESAGQEFGRFAESSAKDRAQKAEALDTKTKRSTSQQKELNQAQEDLARTQKEMDLASAYHTELKTACVDAEVSYEERVAQREEEIASLKEALAALSD